jgi:hypothetical protein
MHEDPLVTVLTPVYNGEAYLAECIESVLAQTYSNWHYIIVNNNSADKTSKSPSGTHGRTVESKCIRSTFWWALLKITTGPFASCRKTRNIARWCQPTIGCFPNACRAW